MKYEFKNDEMIVEAFLDEVTEKQVWFQMVKDGDLKGSYSDVAIENGKLYVKTKPSTFGTNSHNSFEDLMKLL